MQTVPSVRRVFLECTDTHSTTLNTGIQRVVRNLCRHGPATSAGLSTSEPTELLELMKGSSTALSLKKIKKIINDRLDARLYKHELREKWNAMLEKFAPQRADTLPDAILFSKASAFLGLR